jgi:hypothetical protein
MKIKNIFFLFVMATLSITTFAQGTSSVDFVWQSNNYTINQMDYGQINNPAIPIPPASTMGLFSVPPSPGNFEFAVVLAALTGQPLDTGVYEMVEVINEYPNIAALTSPRGGFITLVERDSGGRLVEYYSQSGTVTVTSVTSTTITGTFNAVMEGNNTTLPITGTFTIRL